MTDAGTPTDKLVEVDWTYLTLDEDGRPTTKTETWFAYFTFRSLSEMYKRIGLDEQRAQDLAREADEEDGDVQEDFVEAVQEDVEVTDFEANYYLIWAAFQWHARQRGVKLTPDEVADRITADNVEHVLTEVLRAMEAFETGTLPSREEVEERRDEVEPSGKGSARTNGGGGKSQ